MNSNTEIAAVVRAARSGDVMAFSSLVLATQERAYAAAWHVLRHETDARDVVQEAYITAFRRLSDLVDDEAFAGWLRRIVVATALNYRRRVRSVWVPYDEQSPPILDDAERRWTDEQQRQLARALLTLSDEERHLAELHYYGHASINAIAAHTAIDAATLRKRLQRMRDKLRKEIEMDERRSLGTHPVPQDLPAHIVELLARPRLADLPENPVRAAMDALLQAFPGFSRIALPEDIDLASAERKLGGDVVYIDRGDLHRIEGDRVLRYDLTLPMLLGVRWTGTPQRLFAAGKVYRREIETATHLAAFHQLELLAIDERQALDPWWIAGRVLHAVDLALPNSEVRLTPTDYPMCSRAFSLEVLRDGQWVELLAWGEYNDWVLRALSADPARHRALGVGVGLERVASLKYAIDDVRKVAVTRLA